MSGFNNMSDWEKEFAPNRDHIDDQLLKDEPDADTWHWGILPEEKTIKNGFVNRVIVNGDQLTNNQLD